MSLPYFRSLMIFVLVLCCLLHSHVCHGFIPSSSHPLFCETTSYNSNIIPSLSSLPSSSSSLLLSKERFGTFLASTSTRDGSGPLMVPPQSSLNDISGRQQQSKRNDIIQTMGHMILCMATATILIFMEGYDCSYLKPLSGTIRSFPPVTTSLEEEATTMMKNKFKYYNKNGNNNMMDNIVDIMRSSTRGLGRGKIDRSKDWYEYTYGENFGKSIVEDKGKIRQKSRKKIITESYANKVEMKDIRSYNEIMEDHRTDRVPRWKQEYKARSIAIPQQEQQRQQQQIKESTHVIYNSLNHITQLKIMANKYQWDDMKMILHTEPALTYQLEEACSILRSSRDEFITLDARSEIGFDWGSCAWRHCGALADAQESLSEVYNSIGLFEPYECLFCLDVVERSLRDILVSVPVKYHSEHDIKNLKQYIPNQSHNSPNEKQGESEWPQQIKETQQDNDYSPLSSTVDGDFLNTLSNLRNIYSN